MQERILHMIASIKNVDPSMINAETQLIEELGFDSMNYLNLFLTIERELHIPLVGLLCQSRESVDLQSIKSITSILIRIQENKASECDS